MCRQGFVSYQTLLERKDEKSLAVRVSLLICFKAVFDLLATRESAFTHRQIISLYCKKFLDVVDRTPECMGQVSICDFQQCCLFSHAGLQSRLRQEGPYTDQPLIGEPYSENYFIPSHLTFVNRSKKKARWRPSRHRRLRRNYRLRQLVALIVASHTQHMTCCCSLWRSHQSTMWQLPL